MIARSSISASIILSSFISSSAFIASSRHHVRPHFQPLEKYARNVKVFVSGQHEENEEKREDQTIRPSINYHELEEIEMTEEELEREVKKYKLQTEIDTILNDPDGAPFDLESELKKVTGGISPAMAADSPEMEIEGKVHEVESEMYRAVEAKNYELAQSKKEQLSKMHIDDVGSVLQVNSAFYKAFSNKDYDLMEDVWLHDACAFCIHPSSAPLIGAKNVLNSWSQMFAGGNEAFQKNKIEPTNLRLSVKGTTALVTCDEEVYTKRFVRGKKRVGDKDSKNGMELVNKLVTTNIFRKVGGRWFMIHHHATWHHESEAAKKALNAQSGPSGGKSATSKGEKGNDESDITVENMLGIPGHEGLGGDSDKESGEQKGPMRRVIRGSLSDLLGGGLGDLLGGADDSSSGMGNMGMDSGDDGINVESIIIRSEDLVDNDGDDDDDDTKKPPVVNVQPETVDKKPQPKDTIRQNCIKALRKLSSEGAISPKQKRMLLTDIIVKSSTGEYSMVEVAYDLLCSEGDDEEAGEEDFAEQCKVFAATLPEVPIPIQQ